MHVPCVPVASVTGPSRSDKPEVLRESLSSARMRLSECLAHPWDWNNEAGARWPIAEGDWGRRERSGCPSPCCSDALRSDQMCLSKRWYMSIHVRCRLNSRWHMNSWLCYTDFITDRVGLLGAIGMRATLCTPEQRRWRLSCVICMEEEWLFN